MRYRLITGIDNFFEKNINDAAELGWVMTGNLVAVQVKDQYNDAVHYAVLMVKLDTALEVAGQLATAMELEGNGHGTN